MSFLVQYGEFLLKITTLVIAILVLAVGLFAIARKAKEQNRLKLCINKINNKYQEYADVLNAQILTKSAKKKSAQEKKIRLKRQKPQAKKHVFVLNFHGDIKGSAVGALREEITAILQVATPKDEVVLKLESGGGMVSPYGLAASQLERLKNKQIPLTVSIDKIAASGGYLMACVADKILAAPFAIIGSIGVVAQLPNFNRFLKKKDIDFELLTAGEYKRTLTMFGENTEKAREKTQNDLEEIHHIFKDFIATNRKKVNIEQVATGAHWLAKDAIKLELVDELTTSDDYLMHQASTNQVDIYELKFLMKKTFSEKLSEKLAYVATHINWFK